MNFLQFSIIPGSKQVKPGMKVIRKKQGEQSPVTQMQKICSAGVQIRRNKSAEIKSHTPRRGFMGP